MDNMRWTVGGMVGAAASGLLGLASWAIVPEAEARQAGPAAGAVSVRPIAAQPGPDGGRAGFSFTVPPATAPPAEDEGGPILTDRKLVELGGTVGAVAALIGGLGSIVVPISRQYFDHERARCQSELRQSQAEREMERRSFAAREESLLERLSIVRDDRNRFRDAYMEVTRAHCPDPSDPDMPANPGGPSSLGGASADRSE